MCIVSVLLFSYNSYCCPTLSIFSVLLFHKGLLDSLVWALQRGNCGDGCDLASTLCKYDLRKGDLFVLN